MKLHSVKFKIGLLYILILGIILVLYGSFLYYSLYNTLYHDLDNELKLKAQSINAAITSYLDRIGEDEQSLIFAVRKVFTLEGDHARSKDLQKIEQDWLKRYDKLDLSEDFLHFISLDGESFIKSKNLTKDLRMIFFQNIFEDAKKDYAFKNIKFKKRSLHLVQFPFYYKGKPEYIIQIGTSQKPLIELLDRRKNIIILSIPIILLLTSFIGRSLAASILKPVFEITQTAKSITHEDLSRRLKTEDVDEEMVNLIDAFNNMITRLEKSFAHIEEFSSHVAHELKTPIAVIRGECEIALKKTRSPEEYQRVLKVNLEEAQRMLKTVEDLLLLAKLDYRPDVFKFEPFDLIKFFEELAEQSKILAFEKEIDVKMTLPGPPLKAKGDKLHLRRLFFNIIHNAIKFTPRKGNIIISAKVEQNKVITHISDSGVGIHPEDLPKIFDQFFQKETPHTAISEPSNGLGLNIALSIAKLHHGDIQVQSQVDKGSTFTVTLPILSQSA